ncbi:Hypothetical protein EIN_035370, partial [Entamoeba invadens IP1]
LFIVLSRYPLFQSRYNIPIAISNLKEFCTYIEVSGKDISKRYKIVLYKDFSDSEIHIEGEELKSETPKTHFPVRPISPTTQEHGAIRRGLKRQKPVQNRPIGFLRKPESDYSNPFDAIEPQDEGAVGGYDSDRRSYSVPKSPSLSEDYQLPYNDLSNTVKRKESTTSSHSKTSLKEGSKNEGIYYPIWKQDKEEQKVDYSAVRTLGGNKEDEQTIYSTVQHKHK